MPALGVLRLDCGERGAHVERRDDPAARARSRAPGPRASCARRPRPEPLAGRATAIVLKAARSRGPATVARRRRGRSRRACWTGDPAGPRRGPALRARARPSALVSAEKKTSAGRSGPDLSREIARGPEVEDGTAAGGLRPRAADLGERIGQARRGGDADLLRLRASAQGAARASRRRARALRPRRRPATTAAKKQFEPREAARPDANIRQSHDLRAAARSSRSGACRSRTIASTTSAGCSASSATLTRRTSPTSGLYALQHRGQESAGIAAPTARRSGSRRAWAW